MRWWPTGGLWRHPDFLRLWGAQAVSAVGSRFTRTALPLIAIGSVQATDRELGVLTAFIVAPAVVVGLLVGGRIDRRAKRPVLIAADLLRAGLVLTIPIAAWLGFLGMPLLLVVAAGIGGATTLFQIADNTFLPALVPEDQLLEGNIKLETTEGIAEGVGPALAGKLMDLFGAPFTMALDGLSYLWSAALLSRIRVVEVPAAVEESSVLGDVWVGIRASVAHPLIRPALIADGITTFFGGFYMTLYMLFTFEALALSETVIGLLIGAGGVGALASAWIADPVGRIAGRGPAMVAMLALGLGANLLIPLSLRAGWLAIPLLFVQQVAGDACQGAYRIHALTLRQREVDPDELGRANATFHVLTGAALAVGGLVAGELSTAFGLETTLWIAAIGSLFAVPVLLASSLARLR